MVAITRTQIPDSALQSIEALMGWCGLIMKRYNPTRETIEIENLPPVKNSQATILTDTDGNDRLIVRCSMVLDPAWSSDNTKKLWAHVRELATPGEIAASLKA
jgi:hypothetical protein